MKKEKILIIAMLAFVGFISLWMILHWQTIQKNTVLHGVVDFSSPVDKKRMP